MSPAEVLAWISVGVVIGAIIGLALVWLAFFVLLRVCKMFGIMDEN